MGVSSSCEYAVNFSNSISGNSISGNSIRGFLRLVSGDGVVVSAASASVAAVYEVRRICTFSPEVSITVPDIDRQR